LLGAWLVGRFPLFLLLAATLLVVAIWDWWRFQDRSRTRTGVLGLMAATGVSGAVALLANRPPLVPAVDELLMVLAGGALALALVQLYRGEETVLTLARGWIYLVVSLAVITLYQRLTRDLPALQGPFPSPGYLAAAATFGLLLMPLGHSLDDDRLRRWAYPVTGALACWVVWCTHQSIALGCCVVIVTLWALLHRRGRWVAAGVAVIALGVALSPWRRHFPLFWEDFGFEAPVTWEIRIGLIDTAMTLLRDSWFLGVGPGNFTRAIWVGDVAHPTGHSAPYFALTELAAEYGLGVAVVLLLGFLGVLRWALQRFLRTPGLPWGGPERATALWLSVAIVMLPFLSAIQPRWLSAPMSALIVATLALLARHIERPKGRRVIVGWSLGDTTSSAADSAGPASRPASDISAARADTPSTDSSAASGEAVPEDTELSEVTMGR
jgi:hypothetical protein